MSDKFCRIMFFKHIPTNSYHLRILTKENAFVANIPYDPDDLKDGLPVPRQTIESLSLFLMEELKK
jgi:hypothetical protein